LEQALKNFKAEIIESIYLEGLAGARIAFTEPALGLRLAAFRRTALGGGGSTLVQVVRVILLVAKKMKIAVVWLTGPTMITSPCIF
jgi:hypothetical protein